MKRFLLLLFSLNLLWSQGLFESAQNSSSSGPDISGNILSYIYFDHSGDSLYTKQVLAQSSVKLKISRGTTGFAYADFRLFTDTRRQETGLTLREAYVDLNLGFMGFRLGKQILPWGRADAFKPTDNITPQDMSRLFIDEEEKRLGNLLASSFLNIGSSVSFQGIWIPVYIPNTLPLSVFDLPYGLTYSEMLMPEQDIEHSAYAIKMDLNGYDYDASLSYLDAYALLPVFAVGMNNISPQLVSYTVFPQAWRQKVFGFDAALNFGPLGFRCEIAYMLPDNNMELAYVPSGEIQWTLGIDRSWRHLGFIAEYNGKYISEFTALSLPANPDNYMDYQIERYNRLFHCQTDESIHRLFLRPSLTLFHDIVKLECPIIYNFTTEELIYLLQLDIDIRDAFRISLGINKYIGEENTLNDLLSSLYNGYYCQLKLSF